jgi:monoamine oxidase
MHRRNLLLGGGAALAAPFLPYIGLAAAADVDVVIIGAGAAGLSAAKVLKDKNISFRLLEAKNRIGGRAYSDTTKFGRPFDLGCTYLHQIQANPWANYARKNGIKLTSFPPDKYNAFSIDGHPASDADYAFVGQQFKKIEAAVKRSGRASRDISMLSAAKGITKSKWDLMIYSWLASGIEASNASVMDWWNAIGGQNRLCPSGFGRMVAHFGRSIPVDLGVQVKKIDWSGSGVSVSTNKGTVRAKHCIITVSNGVLLSRRIKFTPAINNKLAVLQGIPMANYMTIGLKFSSKSILPTPRDAYFHIVKSDGTNLSFIEDINGTGVVRCNVHGKLARSLGKRSEAAAVSFAVNQLRAALGKNRVPNPGRSIASAWDKDPYVRGTWSAALPGYGKKRAQLRQSEGGKLHFAGEAHHPNMYRTCGGAYLSGRDTANRLAKGLR